MVTLMQVAELGPAATALAAVVAGTVGTVTLVQRSKADKRDQWWKRTQWAIDLTLSETEDRRAVGYAALVELADSKLASDEDLRLLQVAWQPELDGDRE